MGKSSTPTSAAGVDNPVYSRSQMPAAADWRDRQIVATESNGDRSVWFSDGYEWRQLATWTEDGLAIERPSGALFYVDSPAYAEQFNTTLQTLQTRQIIVTATGTMYLGPCAIVGVRCIAAGSSGTLTIHDDSVASDATKLRLSIAQASLVAGTYYPMVADDAAAMLMNSGAYVTITVAGAFAIDVIDGAATPGTTSAGMLCVAQRATASGLAIQGPASIVSIRVLASGSAGSLIAYDDTAATAGKEILPSVAFGSLVTTQPTRLGPRGGAARVDNLYLTLPTSAVVLINYLPR